jgi:hypothetical protein
VTISRVDTAKGHYYKDETGRVAGVTTEMSNGVPKPALINWAANTTADYAINNWDALADMPPAQRLKTLQGARYAEKDAAANRGTQVHRIAEQLIAGKEVPIPDELAGHAESYVRFLDEFAVTAVAVEFTVYSPKHRYAGTGDLIADITHPDLGRIRALLDVKTNRSGIYGETALQLAAYRYAEIYVTDDGTEIDPYEVEFTGAIHVRGDGYSLIPVTAGPEQFRSFLYVQQVARFVTESRDLVGDAVTPPTTSTYRLTMGDAA